MDRENHSDHGVYEHEMENNDGEDRENHPDHVEFGIENEDGKDLEGCWSEMSQKNMRASYREPLLVKGTIRSNTTSQIAIVGANTCPIESLDYE